MLLPLGGLGPYEGVTGIMEELLESCAYEPGGRVSNGRCEDH